MVLVRCMSGVCPVLAPCGYYFEAFAWAGRAAAGFDRDLAQVVVATPFAQLDEAV